MNYLDILKGLQITSPYGEKRATHTHQGIDVAENAGTPIKSSISGIVKGVYNDPKGYGNYTDIYNPETGITTRYAHAQSLNLKTGQKINAGDILGTVGSTGNSTGSHLHYEVSQNGKTINPMELANIMANTNNFPKNVSELEQGIAQGKNFGSKSLDDLKKQIVQHQIQQSDSGETGAAAPANETKQLFDKMVSNEIQKLMQPQQNPVTQASDILSGFQKSPAEGISNLGKYLQTSQGQNVLGSLFGALGNKNMSTAYAIGANQQLPREDLARKYAQEQELAKENNAGDITRAYLGSLAPKNGSSFRDMADYYYSQGMIDKDKYEALKNTDLYQQDVNLPPSVMGKSLQPFLNKQTHGYRIEEIGTQGGQQRQTANYKEGLPSTQAGTEKDIKSTEKLQEEIEKLQKENTNGKPLPATQQSDIINGIETLKALKAMRQYVADSPAISEASWTGKARGKIASFDPNNVAMQELKARANKLITDQRKGAIGGRLSNFDIQFMDKFLANPTSLSGKVILSNLDAMINGTQQKLQSEMDTYKNTNNLGNLPKQYQNAIQASGGSLSNTYFGNRNTNKQSRSSTGWSF